MRIVTWNALMKFREKIKQLLPFAPDIMVIPECEAPEKWGENAYLEKTMQFLWFGDNRNKGIGIISMNQDYRLALHPAYKEEYRYIIPIQVSGKEDLLLLAVWAQDTKEKYYSYIGQVFLALKHYEPLLRQNSLIIGDWNSHIIFDKNKRVGTHTDTVNFLLDYDIHSVYHSYYNIEQGNEIHPTHYFRKEKHSPFHLDYIFTSKPFLNRLEKVEIGKHDDWITYSDHMPILACFGTEGQVPCPQNQ